MKRHFLFFSILAMAVIYGSFLAIDFTTGFSASKYSAIVRYLCILTCLLLVISARKDANSPRDYRFMLAAFIFTACADFMMSMICKFSIFNFGFCMDLEPYRFASGVGLFLVVQIIYFIRHKQNFKWSLKEIITGVAVFAIMIDRVIEDVGHMGSKGGSVSIVILVFLLVYAFVLCLGTWMAIGTLWRNYFPKTTAWFIAVGMVLFFLCDNSLGRFEAFKESAPLSEKDSFIVFENTFRYTYSKVEGDTIMVFAKGKDMKSMTIPHTLKTICGFLVWLFYLPSQILLMLSAFNLSFLSSVFGLIKPPKGKQAAVYRS